MKPIDWTNIYKKYKGMWVALADDNVTVLGSGKTAKEALAKAQKKGVAMPGLNYVPQDTTSSFVGGF